MIELYVAVFAAGLLFGSFANVCIARIPNNQSVVTPGSRCPKCGTPIEWYDNIPLLSYALLKGKCRKCKTQVSFQYPLVEFSTGLAFVFVAMHLQFTPLLPFYLLFTLALIIISFIDYYHQIIPDVFSFGIIILGVGLASFSEALGPDVKSRLVNSVLGMVVGGGSLFALGFVGEKIMHKESMGGGDIKLMAGIGAMFGWESAISVLFIASLIGSVIGVTLILSKKIERTGYIPFGPFIAAASYLYMLVPERLNILSLVFRLSN